MLRDEGVAIESTWAQQQQAVEATGYRQIDRELRRIAKRRAGLDVEEARWLREADKQRIWRKLGFSTALEYLEDVFGYAPRTAMERLRVAKELAQLPALEAELRAGALPWSAAKELTRVMTPRTEAVWLARARGKNLRDIEELVAGHAKGDGPDGPKNPDLMTRRWVVELPPAADALLEQCRLAAATERGSHVDDAALVELLCRDFLAGSTASSGKPARPAHRIVIHRCDDCGRGWQDARGRRIELPVHVLERAACDAELVHDNSAAVVARAAGEPDLADGDQDGQGGQDDQGDPGDPGDQGGQGDPGDPGGQRDQGDQGDPGGQGDQGAGSPTTGRSPRPTPNIPARVRKLVWDRDRGRCRMPGCRATRNLEIHHIVHRADGGTHEPTNLLVICSGHHQLHHEGLLSITGCAPDELVFEREGTPLVDARSAAELNAAEQLRANAPVTTRKPRRPRRSRFEDVVTFQHAKQALIDLRYTPRAAREVLEQVIAQLGEDADVGSLVRAALRRGDDEAEATDHLSLASKALVQLGYPPPVATAAIEKVRAHVDADTELDALIKEALRFCS